MSTSVGGELEQNLTPFANLLLAAEVDAKDWASDSHKFGIGLTLSA